MITPPQSSAKTAAGDVGGSAADPDLDLLARMLPDVYQQLRELAGAYLQGERSGHTLQATALVHEAYLRLVDQRRVDWTNRAQFIGIAARMMRRVLRNHARARTADKRGGPDALRLTLDDALEFYQGCDLVVSDVDDALTELEELDPRLVQVVELRFFGGLTIEEVAHVLRISPATVKREWHLARAWLQRKLSQEEN